MEALCLAPIDTIKTRLQLDKTNQYNGIRHCGQTIIRTEGVAALWKGVIPFSTHLTFKYALRMSSNSFYQNLLRDKDGKLDSARRLASGAMAGATEAVCIVTPFEVVKTRLQAQRGLDPSQMKYKVRYSISNALLESPAVSLDTCAAVSHLAVLILGSHQGCVTKLGEPMFSLPTVSTLCREPYTQPSLS